MVMNSNLGGDMPALSDMLFPLFFLAASIKLILIILRAFLRDTYVGAAYGRELRSDIISIHSCRTCLILPPLYDKTTTTDPVLVLM